MLALDFGQAKVHDRFFAPLFSTVRNGPDEETLRASLLEFMDSKRVNERTDDDKTLLLATRITPMSRQAYPTQLRDHSGTRSASLQALRGRRRGAVFDVVGRPDLVAKLYSKPQSKERCDKLRAMAKLCSPDLLKIAAWPTATLSNGNPAAVDGILMPRIVDHKEIHHLYSVAQRKKDFPEADWGFLLHTARNCAIAFEAVHQHGHVVGDVNQKNVMVSKKGIVALVDCDSFQVAEGSRIFRCGVGVPEYTPPELHGKNFASLDRPPTTTCSAWPCWSSTC